MRLLRIIAANSSDASRGESAATMADTTATPSTPRAMTSPMVLRFMPPIATQRWRERCITSSMPSRPKGASVSVFVGVAYTGEIPM